MTSGAQSVMHPSGETSENWHENWHPAGASLFMHPEAQA